MQSGTEASFNPFFPPTAFARAVPNAPSWVEAKQQTPIPGGLQWQQAQQKPLEAATTAQTQSSVRVSATNADDSGHSLAGAGKAKGGALRLEASQSGIPGGGSEEDGEGEDDDKSQRRSSHGSDSYTDYGGSDDDDSEDDDKPLAQAHPEAMQAQKSLRLKEKERTKRGKSSRAIVQGQVSGSPKHMGDHSQAVDGTASQAVSRSASAREPTAYQHRPLPRKKNTAPAEAARNPFGFTRDELSHKSKALDLNKSRTGSLKQDQKRPESSGSRPHALLLPQTDEHVKRRNRANGKQELAPPLAPFVQDSVLTMSEASEDDDDVVPLRANTSGHSHSSANRRVHTPLAPLPSTLDRAPSTIHPSPIIPSMSTAVPAISAPAEVAAVNKPAYHSKQRIYINDPQHHSIFDIDERTTAVNVLAQLRAKNAISDNPAYVVVEMWRTLGVERAVRDYEFLQDCIESWGNDANSSLFLVKKSNLASWTREAAVQGNAAAAAGAWVQMETKRGKWSKRWLEVRNQGVFIGKSEKVSRHDL